MQAGMCFVVGSIPTPASNLIRAILTGCTGFFFGGECGKTAVILAVILSPFQLSGERFTHSVTKE